MNVPKRVNDQWRNIQPHLAKVQPRLAKVQPHLAKVQTKKLGRVLSINSAPRRADRSTVEQGSLLTEIDHVAIAVRDIDAAIEWYEVTFGATVAHRERVERDGVEEALVKVADSYVQLVTPTREDSPVARYLEKRGEGLHHVAFRVDDCAATLAVVKAHGAQLIDEEPRPGSRGTRVAFVHPTSSFGTLIELVQES
jgi:methylmalonyl-CoA/ethylmalonyl-CoA epimerase